MTLTDPQVWQIIIGAVVLFMGGGLLAWWRFAKVEAPQGEAAVRKVEVEAQFMVVQGLKDSIGMLREELAKRDEQRRVEEEERKRQQVERDIERRRDQEERDREMIRLRRAHDEFREDLAALRAASEEAKIAIAVHGTWDKRSHAEILTAHPTWPPPPPLGPESG